MRIKRLKVSFVFGRKRGNCKKTNYNFVRLLYKHQSRGMKKETVYGPVIGQLMPSLNSYRMKLNRWPSLRSLHLPANTHPIIPFSDTQINAQKVGLCLEKRLTIKDLNFIILILYELPRRPYG